MKRKILKTLLICAAIILPIALLCSINAINLRIMQQEMLSIIKQSEGVTILDDACVYGNLNGNGNGINYYGAALVTSKSEAALEELVESLDGRFELAGYALQNGKRVESKYLEHRSLRFEYNDFLTGQKYYIVYFYNSQSNLSNYLDIAGH